MAGTSVSRVNQALRDGFADEAGEILHRRRVLWRNVRTIEVLIDQEAVTSGEAAHGQPWKISVPSLRDNR